LNGAADIWAVIPVKETAAAKERLADAVPRQLRAEDEDARPHRLHQLVGRVERRAAVHSLDLKRTEQNGVLTT